MKKFRHLFTKNSIVSGLIIFVTLSLLATSAYFKMIPINNTLDDNKIAVKNVYAPYDYYDEEGTIALADKVAEETGPVLSQRFDATFSAFEDIALFFDDTDMYREEIANNQLQSTDFTAYLNNRVSSYILMCGKKGISINSETAKLLLATLTDAQYANFKSVVTENFSSVQNRDVFEGNRDRLLEEYKDETQYTILDEKLNKLSIEIAQAFLRINSIVNAKETAAVKSTARNDIMNNHAIIIYEGSLIIAKGDVATEDTIRLLDKMDLSGTKQFNEKIFIGIALILILLLVPIFVFKALFSYKKKYTKRHILVICFLLVFLFVIVFLLPGDLRLYIPVFFLPILITILVDEKMAIIVGAAAAVFLGFVYRADTTYISILIIGGILSAFFAKRITVRLKLLASGLAIGVFTALVLFTATLVINGNISDVVYDMLALLANGMLSVILVLGLLPLFESVFNIITPFKLLELANPNRPLLKRLLMEAPGTYHHSLMVGNLAEEASNEIGANGLLARVGSYYHDIGKMSRPMFFKENQGAEENPHNKMKPELSKLVITSHTKEGDEIAKKYKLPHAIRDIIMEHHGTTQVKYFYNKALENNGGDVNPDAFRYQGSRPRSKESAVVMLADSVEATVRSKGDISRGEVEGIIRKSIKDKLDDGQFDLCDLTLKDFDDISNAFMRVFGGYFHKRIEYPEPPEGMTDSIES
ncbi:MAG: HDIG domain-containing protein [Clostridiales bacterium]|nr:HDIG domain-containing protein [Clostridiales bacterium]